MIHIKVSPRDREPHTLCRAVVPDDACIAPVVAWHFRPEDAAHFGICRHCLRKLWRPPVLRIPHEFKPPMFERPARQRERI